MSDDKPIIPAEELTRRAREAVVLGYQVGFDVSKGAILLKVRLHTKQDRCFLITTMTITALCQALEQGKQFPEWGLSYENRHPTIEERDWLQNGHSRVARAICGVAQNCALLGLLLENGQTKVLTIAPPHALDIAKWIREGLAAGSLIDIGEPSASPPQ